MTKKNAVLNIGNTCISAAWVRQGRIVGEMTKINTHDLLASALTNSVLHPYLRKNCLIACVVPKLREMIEAYYPETRFLDAGMTTSDMVDFSRVDTSTLGADRIANAVAAASSVRPPVVVVDCGTAVTLEVVDQDRCFRGGAILPGRRLQRLILHQDTGLLPLTDLPCSLPLLPAANTREAIIAGVDGGLAGAINGLLQKIKGQPGYQGVKVLIVGGDGPFFAPLINDAELMDEYFTLRGLACIIHRS